MKKIQLLCLFALSLLLFACGGGKTATMHPEYDPETTENLLAPGNNSVKGNAFIRQNTGNVITCAGREVYLTPVTPFSEEVMHNYYGTGADAGASADADTGFAPINANGEYKVTLENNLSYKYEAMRTSLCDGQGYFNFEGLQDGDYYLQAKITWKADDGKPHGGKIMKKVHLQGGKTTNTVLSR